MNRTGMANGRLPIKGELSVDDALQLLNDRQNASAALNNLLQKEMGDHKVADSYQAFRVRYLAALGRLYPDAYEKREDLSNASEIRSHMRKLRQQGKEKKVRYDEIKDAWFEYDAVATDKPEVLSSEDKRLEKQLDDMEEDINEAWRNFAEEVMEYAKDNGEEKRDYVEEWKEAKKLLKRDLKIIKQRHVSRNEMRKRAEIRRIEDIVRARKGEDLSEGFSLDGEETKKSYKSKRKKKGSGDEKKNKKDKSKNGDVSSDESVGDSKLLEEVFPPHIAQALREGRKVEPEEKESVTIFFSDIVGFTNISSSISPLKVSDMLDRLYQKFDALAQREDVFKVETIGDSWMGATNLTKDQPDHALRMARFAVEALKEAQRIWIDPEDRVLGKLNLRVGFHSGPVVANVVGSLNPRYCLFGDTINVASRMESNSVAGRIQCSWDTAQLIKKDPGELFIVSRGEVEIKGKGTMETFWVCNDETIAAELAAEKTSSDNFVRKSVGRTFSNGLKFWKKPNEESENAQPPESEKGASSAGLLKRWKKTSNKAPTADDTQRSSSGSIEPLPSERRASLNSTIMLSKSQDRGPKPLRRASEDGISGDRTDFRKGQKRSSLLDVKRSKSAESTPENKPERSNRAERTVGGKSTKKKRETKNGTKTMTKAEAIGALMSSPSISEPKEKSNHDILKTVAAAPARPTSKTASSGSKAKAYSTKQSGKQQIDKILARCIESLKEKGLSAEDFIKYTNEVYEMAKLNETRQREFGSGSGVEALVEKMERFKNDEGALEAAFRLSSVLAQVESNREEFALHGIIAFILKALKKHASSPVVLRWALTSLANLCETTEYQNQIVTQNGLDVIMEVQKAKTAEGNVQIACFRTLRGLAKNSKDNAISIAANGGIWAVMGVLQSKSFALETVIDLHIHGFSALAEFARVAEPNRVSIAAAGGIPSVIGAMTCFTKNGDLLAAGVDALYCLSKDHPKNCDTIVAYDGIKIIAGFMKKHKMHEGVQEKGVLAIGMLLDKSNTAKFMTPDDTVDTVKHALELHAGNGALQEVGRDLLEELA